MAEFNADLATGVPEDHIALAQEIADFVEHDVTVPTAEDRDAWRSDFELRALESLVGHAARTWDRYADICGRAVALLTAEDSVGLLLLAQFNGERRVMEPDEHLVRSLIDRSGRVIESLNPSPRRERLQSLREYHIGIWCRRIGDYLLAAEQQDRSAVQAETAGDLPGAAIARLCAVVERFNHAFSSGEVTSALFDTLHGAAHHVVDTCTGADATQLTWRLLNAPGHVLLAHIWQDFPLAGREIDFWLDRLNDLEQEDNKMFQVHRADIMTVRAGVAYLQNNRLEAHRLANGVLTTLRDSERVQAMMTARLILSRLACDEHLQVVKDEGDWMHQLRRFAERVLAGEVPVLANNRHLRLVD